MESSWRKRLSSMLRRWWLLVLALPAFLLALVAAIYWLPAALTPSAGVTATTRLGAENAARAALVAALALVGAAALTAWVTWRASKANLAGQEIDRQGQITDRYTKAIDQLGSDKVDVRIGGIYALERIACDSARDRPSVMEVLTAFVREHSCEPSRLPVRWAGFRHQPVRQSATRADVQSAATVIGRRKDSYHAGQIDLTGACLGHAYLAGAKLSGANLTGAKLGGANLTDAKLGGAKLSYADVADADLRGADLTGASLSHSDLTSTNLGGATLGGTYLIATILVHAYLGGANLTYAKLGGAKLANAVLTNAKLVRADLNGADLTGAKISLGAPDPEGWVRDTGSGLLMRASEEPGDAP